VATKQERYERTPKGRQARQQAIATYRDKRVKWEVWLDAEMSEALEALIPDGVSRSEYLRKIFQKHLDKVYCMIHTEGVEETNEPRSQNK
jgi:hypothetical protein